MSALTDPIASAIRGWSLEQSQASIGRLDIRRVPVPDADRYAFCEALRTALSLKAMPLEVDDRNVLLWTNGADRLAVVVAPVKPSGLDGQDAWVATQDFAIRLRDLHSDEASPLSKLNLVLVLDSDMESLTSTSVDLTRRDELRPSRLVAATVPAAESVILDLLALEPVASALDQALRTPEGNARIAARLDAWRHEGLPPAETFLTELLGWFPDPELCSIIEERRPKSAAQERASLNKEWSDRVLRLQEKGADAQEWGEAFSQLSQNRIPNLIRDGPGAFDLATVIKQPATPRFEGFRYRKGSNLLAMPRTKNELHLVSCQGKAVALSAEYSQAPSQIAFRVTVDGVAVPEASVPSYVEQQGKDLRIKLPDNQDPQFHHYIVEVYYGRSTTRGRASQTVRALVSPRGVPELILENFLVGDVHRPGIIISVSPPTTIQSVARRITRTRTATPAFDDAQPWPLPCRIENGPSELRLWHFEDETGPFDLPIACEDSPDAAEPPAFYGVLLDPTIREPRPGFWTLEAEGRGIQEAVNHARRALNVGAQEDLRRERAWVEHGWLTAFEDSRHEWLDVLVPGSIATHAEVAKVKTEYKRLFIWLQGRGTLPSLVEPWALDYWQIVDDLLAAVRACIASTSPGQQNRIVWASMLGCLKDLNGVLLRTGPLWPPAMASASTLAKRLREGKLDYSQGLLQALSPTSLVPVNLAAPGVGRLSLARRRTIWTWAEWTPVDRQADGTHLGLGRVFRSTLDRFIDSFRQLSGDDVPAALRVRFIHVVPDQNLVESIENFVA
ncbi:MAG: hypothetical protein ACYDBQ_02205, partial [Thermoplasmatota archaeon]